MELTAISREVNTKLIHRHEEVVKGGDAQGKNNAFNNLDVKY
jgi:hypothetical protein